MSVTEGALGVRHIGVAIAQLIVAALIVLGVFVGLPARVAWVDWPAAALVSLYLASALSLVARRPWALALARVASALVLLTGMALVTALACSVAHLAGQYGPVGRGGAMLMVTMAVLVLPYVIALPVWQLRALR